MPEGFKITEIGLLPEEWEVIPFTDSLGRRSGNIPDSIQRGEYKPTGKYPIVDQSEKYIAGYTDEAVRLYSSDLPIIIFGDHTRTFKFVDFPFAIGADGTKILNPNRDLFDPKYFYYYLFSLDIPSRGYNRHFKVLKEKAIVKPPLPEQKAIALILFTIQKAIETQDKLIAAAKELKKSLVNHLFTYGPVPFVEADKVPLKETEIGFVPDHWEVKSLIDVSTLQRGKDLPKQNQIFGQYPIIGSSGVIGYHKEFVCVGPGVVTGRSGSIGNYTYVEENYWPHNTGLYVKDFHGNNPKFIYYLFHLVDFRKYATGVSVPTLNRNCIHSAIVAIPPQPEQVQIARMLSTVDNKIQSEEKHKEALQTLFKTMLHNLMTGKVRVKEPEAQMP
jgi:type I restriction enzyme S subunit